MNQKSVKITISEVTRVETPKTKDAYFNKQTGETIDWSKWYGLADEEKENFAIHEIETGEVKTTETELKIYEQELPKLDVGEIAMFINRAR